MNNIIALPPAASFAVRQNSHINLSRNCADFADFRTSPLYTMRRKYDYNRYRLPKAVFQAGRRALLYGRLYVRNHNEKRAHLPRRFGEDAVGSIELCFIDLIGLLPTAVFLSEKLHEK